MMREKKMTTDPLRRNYDICEEIGRGQYGVVSRCVCRSSGKSFACKSINKRLISKDDDCIFNEASIMGSVSGNPNVLQIINFIQDEKYIHMIFELCDHDLFDLFQQRRHTFAEREAAALMLQLLTAVHHCHKHGVAHRDIKPENIFFDFDNKLKLGDFGLAARFGGDGDGHLMMSGGVGTLYYQAPEIVAGKKYYDEKVDVWSCGVVLYVMLAGTYPFKGNSDAEIYRAILRDEVTFPNSVSQLVEDLLSRMLCKDVSRRISVEEALTHPWIAFWIACEKFHVKLDQVPRHPRVTTESSHFPHLTITSQPKLVSNFFA